MPTCLALSGLLLAVGGLATEFVAVVAMGYWPMRRRLPSPFALLSWGGIAFFVGAAMLVIGQSLRQSG